MFDGVVQISIRVRHVLDLKRIKTCAISKKKSNFFGDFGCERLLVFIIRWSFIGLQRIHGRYKMTNV